MRFRRNHQERNHRQRIETIAPIQGPSNRRTEGIQGTQAHEERLNHQEITILIRHRFPSKS